MNPIRSHERGALGSSLVYPVISRRAGGLSLGINLFPGKKVCNFDCPYCEVPAWKMGISSGSELADPDELERELNAFLTSEYPRRWADWPIKDLCFSGDGEPSLSPILIPALEACARVREKHPGLAGAASIRIITNATGFLKPEIRADLARFAMKRGLSVWAKLDSGSQEGFSAMSRSGFDLELILEGIAAYGRLSPLTIQTMVCSLKGREPGADEVDIYARRLEKLWSAGALIEAVHVYTLARPPLEPWVEALPRDRLQAFIDLVGAVVRGRFPVLGFEADGIEALEARW
ncbi:MAG TPA: hypothetical protein VIO60_10890 [Rectinemataceae bacterium]